MISVPIQIPILFEDNHLLVVEKPVNVLSQEDHTGDPDMLTLLKEDLKRRYEKPGNVFLGLVHRLDRPVGGVMVFAKTSKAASRLSEQIRARSFEKYYLAVIHGKPKKNKALLKHFISKDEKSNTVFASDTPSEGYKEVLLDYEVKGSADSLSLVWVHLHTGRPHQIRVQFAQIGHALYGDQKYGAKQTQAGEQIALWSCEIHIQHPTQKTNMRFESRPPKVYPWNLFTDYMK